MINDWFFAVIAMVIVFFYGLFNYDASNGLCSALVVLIIELLYRISKKNPFERSLTKLKYRISPELSAFDYSITFEKDATLDALKEALFNIIYSGNRASWSYRDPAICFENFHRWNSIVGSFRPFHFSSISFEYVDSAQFNCYDYLLLPCQELYFPSNIQHIDFSIDSIPYIEKIVLRSPKFVPLHYYSETFFSNPIKVTHPLDIIVPANLEHTYRTDPGWRSIRLITPDDKTITPTINGLPPYDPATQSHIYY